MLTLNAQSRIITGKKVEALRKKGIIPAIVYGHGIKSRNLSLESLAFQKIYQEAGESSIINLIISDNPLSPNSPLSRGGRGGVRGKTTPLPPLLRGNAVSVLIQDIQTDPLTDKIIHIDFHQVKETEKVTTEIELKFVGESRVVKEQGGVLIKNLNKIKVEALPKDLVSEIEVDISKLISFDEIIHLSDLKIPEGIKVLEKPDEVVAMTQAPREEKIIEEKAEAEKIAEVEKVGEKKEEGGEGEEKGEKER